MAQYTREKVVVVGAGPVGALAAIYAAQRGYNVEVYELRADLRDPSVTPLNFTRSINLAVSERGINSIRVTKRPGLVEKILEDTFPMYARMVHVEKGGELVEHSQNYDINGKAIMAADRGLLNKRLLDELEHMSNVRLYFNHKLTGADFQSKLAWFERQDLTAPVTQSSPHNVSNRRRPEVEVLFDFMIGADGAHSAVRFHLMKFARVSYKQEYIDTLWCEFHIPPTPTSDFRLSPSHLHIWPASPSMFIAIPNADRSFTATLFMPVANFAHLSTSPETLLLPFFARHFPGLTPALIPPSLLLSQYTTNPHLPLISIKCAPYHYAAAAVILGDAAHAMVPFYGQGMNAGLEDVRVLFDTLDAHPADARAAALAAYTALRAPSAHAINDLAMANYAEMCSGVRSPLYLARKRLEEELSVRAPWLGFATQYARVSFSNVPYAEVVRVQARQKMVLEAGAAVVGVGVVVGVWWALGGWLGWRGR